METNLDRLVRRVQRRLLSVNRSTDIGSPDVTALEDRVRRLRATGDRFDHVALSAHVVARSATGVLNRVGGECVATEV